MTPQLVRRAAKPTPARRAPKQAPPVRIRRPFGGAAARERDLGEPRPVHLSGGTPARVVPPQRTRPAGAVHPASTMPEAHKRAEEVTACISRLRPPPPTNAPVTTSRRRPLARGPAHRLRTDRVRPGPGFPPRAAAPRHPLRSSGRRRARACPPAQAPAVRPPSSRRPAQCVARRRPRPEAPGLHPARRPSLAPSVCHPLTRR